MTADNDLPGKDASVVSRKDVSVSASGKGRSAILIRTAAISLSFIGLYFSSRYSYLLFHSLVELSTIAVAFTLFTLTWNTRRLLASGYLKALGIGYGLIALIDLLHALAYKGMGIFPGDDANLPTQLWIAARGLQALLLCLAPLLARRDLNEKVFFGISLVTVFGVTALVYLGLFPDCFIEGKGLTPFKIASEYLISAVLLAALCLFIARLTAFKSRVFYLLVFSILCTIGSELAFTSYLSVYGPANMAGHFFKLAAFYLVYQAVVVTGFKEPFALIIQDLEQKELAFSRGREFNQCLLESMADGVVACDAQGILTLFNRTAREWHGLDPLRLPPEQWAEHYDLFRADGVTPLPTDEIPLARAFRGESVREAGMAIKAKGQPIRFILSNGEMIRDAAGKKLGAVAVMRDVTELRRMEQDLRRANEELTRRVDEQTAEIRANEHRLAEAQRIAHIGSWERDLDTDHIYLSKEALNIFGLPTEEFGDDLRRWHRQWIALIHPEDRKRLQQAYTEALSGTKDYDEEYRIVRPDGEVRLVHSLAHIERDRSGQPHRVLGTMQDITERKRIENAQRETALRLNEAQRLAHIGSWELDLQTNHLSWSDEIFRIFEIDPEQFGASYEAFLDAIHPEDREAVDAAYTGSLASRTPYAIDHRLRFADGRIKYVHEQCETIYDNGTPLRSIGTVQDITERKLMEDALFFVAQRGWQTGGENFCEVLAQFLGERLAMDYVIIDRLAENPEMAETLAIYAKGGITPNLRYALKGTPCENVMGRQLCVYPQKVQQQFPEDSLLAEMGVDSYIGIPLWDSTGRPIGLIALLDSRPIADPGPAIQVLQLVATRASAELEREESELSLRRREREFRTLAENSPDCIARYDSGCQTVYVNPALERTLAVSASEMLGQTPSETPLIDEAKEYQEKIAEVLATGEAAEIDLVLPDRGEGQRYHNVRFVAERGENDAITGVLAIGRDITERKFAEEQMLRSEQRLRLHREQSPLGFLEWDENFRAVEWNAACEKIFGYRRDEAIGRHGKDLILPAELHDLADGIYQNLMSQTGGQHSINENITKDGRTIVCEWFNTTLIDKAGKAIGVASICNDITEQKRMETELASHRERLEAQVKERTAELEHKNAELERMNKLFVGRELRMVELKRKIEELEIQNM